MLQLKQADFGGFNHVCRDQWCKMASPSLIPASGLEAFLQEGRGSTQIVAQIAHSCVTMLPFAARVDSLPIARHTAPVKRRLAILLVLAGLSPGLVWRAPAAPEDRDPSVWLHRLALPASCCRVGPVTVDQAWWIDSKNTYFGGYSAVLALRPGRLLAFSDNGLLLDIAAPHLEGRAPARIAAAVPARPRRKGCCDAESATFDPQTGRLWIAFEGSGVIQRRRTDLSPDGEVRPVGMQSWPGNQGAEAMTRLPDGRFIVLSEAFVRRLSRQGNPGLLFPGDPLSGAKADSFTFAGHPGYRPTDMAALPDGRVLIVMRQVRWPMPIRFGVRLMLADPKAIRAGGVWKAIDLGEIAAPLPVDNYEGLALVPEADGSVTGWLIADDNAAALQRTLLLRLRITPSALPGL